MNLKAEITANLFRTNLELGEFRREFAGSDTGAPQNLSESNQHRYDDLQDAEFNLRKQALVLRQIESLRD